MLGGCSGMARTSSAAALLHVCLQDLHAGKAMQADPLRRLAAAATEPALAALIADEEARTRTQRARLEGLADLAAAPENLWMKGVLDDAERDTRSHQPGRLLDIAIVGAIRKAKAAEIVSSETAIVLAAGAAPELLAALRANWREEAASDAALRERLITLADATADLFA